MAKIIDPNAGVPGGYFLAEDGETHVNAKGDVVESMSDAALAKYPSHFVKPDASRVPTVARVVTVTQAELDREAKAAAKAQHDASEPKDVPDAPAVAKKAAVKKTKK